MNIKQLKQILTRKINEKELKQIYDSLIETFGRFYIDTPLRQSHFLGQVLHESGQFKYKEEIWGPTKWQKRYEGRKDLGNVMEGDGYNYRGRGFIQLTGRTNYTEASVYFNEDFITNPEFVSEYPYNALIAGWFWKKRNLNKYADADDIILVTKRINGGINGLDDRMKWTEKAKKVLT